MSLRARLAIAFSLVVALGVAAASTASYIATRAELEESVEDFLRARSRELADGARSFPQNSGDRAGRPPPPPLPFDPDAITQTLDPSGDIIANTGGELPVDDADRAIASLGRGSPKRMRDVVIDGESFRMITEHIAGGGAVQVARSLEEIEDVLADLRNRALLIGLGLSIVAAGAGWFVASRTTRPLRSLTDSAERIAQTQDLTTPTDVDGTDEVGRLASSFDEMLAALADSKEQQRRLIQDAGHELRTPLTTLRANIELLQRAPDLEEPARSDLLNAIRSELAELNTLFTELIELATDARAETPLQATELDDPAERALDVFRSRSSREVEASFSGGIVLGDAELLERVVANLLGNADKFSPTGTTIALVVDGGTVVVQDRGPGIAVSERSRVFDRFYRSENARTFPGSGLGLAIVKQIVDRHEGTVHVAESPWGGAEVGFTLPLLARSR